MSEVSCARSIIKSFFCSSSLKCHPSFLPTPRSDYRSFDPVVTVIFFLNPLSPNGDQHQFSPNNIHTFSLDKVMRINEIITKEKMLWSIFSNSLNYFFKEMYSWVARDVTNNQTKKLSILLSFYFHGVLQYLNTFT